MCGGTYQIPDGDRRDQGLSPRVRGNHHGTEGYDAADGSIPACAGEPQALAAVLNGLTGLSPRVRGNLGKPLFRRHLPGSIPACAGEPSVYCLSAPIHRVYPRVCGGTHPRTFRRLRIRGLSPRVRGNLHCC